MTDVTRELLKEKDYKKQAKVNQLTRQDILMDQFKRLAHMLDTSKPITTIVISHNSKLEQKEYGTIEIPRELVSYYNETHVVHLSIKRNKNLFILRIGEKLRNTSD